LGEPQSQRAGVPAACLNPDSSLFLRGAACKIKCKSGVEIDLVRVFDDPTAEGVTLCIEQVLAGP